MGPISYILHKGPRETQEDTLAILKIEGRIVLIVADGLGGLEDGAVTSYKVANNCIELAREQSIIDKLRLNSIILRDGLASKGATTLSLLEINTQGLLKGAHIGDSPYRIIRDGKCIYQNRLHTYYNDFIDEVGRFINGESNEDSINKIYQIKFPDMQKLTDKLRQFDNITDNIYRETLFDWASELNALAKKIFFRGIINEARITKSIDCTSRVAMEFKDVELQNGDIVVLSTDGISPVGLTQKEDGTIVLALENLVSTEDIVQLVNSSEGDTSKIAQSLLELSRNRRGTDNLAMIVFKYEPSEITPDGRWKSA
jgi:serine/threonine protein phosphatase PrpC